MKRIKNPKVKIGWLVAVILLSVVIVYSSLFHRIQLDDASDNVTVQYIPFALNSQRYFSEVYRFLTEDEYFSSRHEQVFKGTVKSVQNIKLDFSGDVKYWSIVSVRVENTYVGDAEEGSTVTSLVSIPINPFVKVEDAEIVSHLKRGVTGIFFPEKYDDDSYFEVNGERIRMSELAQYGMGGGSYGMFLDVGGSLKFNRYTYTSLSEASSLDEVEQYVIKMLDKHEASY